MPLVMRRESMQSTYREFQGNLFIIDRKFTSVSRYCRSDCSH